MSGNLFKDYNIDEKEGLEEKSRNFSMETEEINLLSQERSLRKRKKKPVEDSQQFPTFRRGRQDLSLREKINILEMLDANPKMSQRKIAVTCNVSQSQISRIQNKKSSLMKEWLNGNWERKRNRIGKGGGMLEDKLLKWYNEAKKECIPLSGPLLMEKAKAIALEHHLKFTPTSGWFGRWKIRHNISLKGLKVKNVSMSYSKLCHHWRRYTFTKLTKNIDPNNVWFVGETNLYFNATINHVKEIDSNSLNLKNIDILLAFSSNGIQRRNPLVVGLENITNENLPVSYYHSENGHLTKKILGKWLETWDSEQRSLQISIVLFLQKTCYIPDNLRLTYITLHFYPESSHDDPLQIQPFSRDISTTFKSLFRYQISIENNTNELLSKQISVAPTLNTTFIGSISCNFPVELHLIDALSIVRRTWMHMNPDVLVKGIAKAGLSKELFAFSVDCSVPSPPMLTPEQFNSLVNIEKMVHDKSFTKFNATNIESEPLESPNPTTIEVLMSCQILKKFMQKESMNQLDQLAEIEAYIQGNLLKKGGASSVSHPMYSTDSIHSLEGHKSSLNKRQVTSKIQAEQSKDDSNSLIPPKNNAHHNFCAPSFPDVHKSASDSQYSQIALSAVDALRERSVLQRTPQNLLSEYSAPNSQSIVDHKTLPTRIGSDLQVDQRFAILQHQPRTLHEMSPHIMPVAEGHSQTSSYITFVPHC